jgi:hypothetical protein
MQQWACAPRLAAAAVLSVILSACGGGGGGGTADPGPGIGLTLSADSVAFSAVHNGAIPPSQSIQIAVSRADAVYIDASYPLSVAPATWLSQNPPYNAGSGWALSGGPTTTSMSPGTYSTTVRVSIRDINRNVLAYRDLAVNYTITSVPLAVSPAALSFSRVLGGPAPAAQSVTLMGDIASWTASADQAWIGLASASGSGGGTVGVSVDTSGLSADSYTGTITFSSGGKTATVAVSLLVTLPAFQTSLSSLSFSGVNGTTIAPQSLAIGMNNGAPVGWSAASGAPWLVLDRASGTQSDPLVVSVNPAIGPLASGSYSSAITLTASFGGRALSLSVPVSLNLTKPVFQPGSSSLSFSGINGATLSPQSLGIAISSGTATAWSAASGASWLVLDKGGGTTPDTLSVRVDPAVGPLASGVYNSTITFTGAVNGDSLTKTVGVTLTLTKPVFLPSSSSLPFSGVNGATLAPQSLSIGISNGSTTTLWNAASGAPWLVIDKASGTSADTLGVRVDPAVGPLASGVYNSAITLTGAVNGDSLSKTVNVALSLTKAALTVSPGSVTFGGSTGRDLSAVPLQLSLNTGANAFAWASTASSFVQAAPAAGSASAAPLAVTLTPVSSGLVGGTYTGSVNFSAQVNGDTVTAAVPLTFNLDAHKLLVDGNGVAFASTPSLSSVSRTLRVRDNFGRSTAWSAASSQPWLTATASGTADGTSSADLALAVDPAQLALLAPDNLYLATVTITSPDSSVENTEIVRVGLWVGSTTPAAPPTSISASYSYVAADPIRPYAYLTGPSGGDVQIYNVYSESQVGTIPAVAAQAGDMAVSHDGSTLWVIDTTNFKIVPVNLDTHSVGTPIAVGYPPLYLEYARTDGTGLVISGTGQIFNAATRAAYAPTFSGGYYGNVVVSAARNGTRLCTIDTGLSPYSIACYPLDATSANGGQLLLGASAGGAFGVGSNGKDVAVNADGTRAYAASGAPYEFDVYDAATMSVVQHLPGNAYPNAVEVASDGRIFAGAFVWYDPVDVWVYNPGGTLLATYRVASYAQALLDRQLKVSGDGLRMITLTSVPALVFTTVGP